MNVVEELNRLPIFANFCLTKNDGIQAPSFKTAFLPEADLSSLLSVESWSYLFAQQYAEAFLALQ
ncbi:MAG: hypothetical protein WBA57_11050 [Elainellaceae cyanobacterium]